MMGMLCAFLLTKLSDLPFYYYYYFFLYMCNYAVIYSNYPGYGRFDLRDLGYCKLKQVLMVTSILSYVIDL
jgi:hypothetical protein